MQECEEFENRHRSIMSSLRHDASGAGNLVLAVDLFHEGSTYYKVTERIDTTSLETPQHLDPRKKAVLLKTLGLSLRLLHDINVVHGDLKPGNVLIQKKHGNTFYTAKLIDFDESYLSGQPPERGSIAGDPIFGAPEWRGYLQGDPSVLPESLTTSVDMFALGLMTHYYLTGDLPGFDDKYGASADAVNDGGQLRVDDRLTGEMQTLVRSMTARSPAARPRVGEFLDALGDPAVCALSRRKRPRGGPADKRDGEGRPAGGAPTARTAVGGIAADGARRSRLRTHVEPSGAAEPNGTSARTSRLRINLGGDRDDRGDRGDRRG
jgi:serine/threonine protein kinase